MSSKFSILIPTWNNLSFLKLCIESIRKNSSFNHQILIHVNDGSDGTLEWVQEQGFLYNHSTENVGICLALNGLRFMVATDYILYINDDMYVLPQWDLYLWQEIEKIGHNKFFLSSTMIEPGTSYCKSVISNADYGKDEISFREDDLLREFRDLPHFDWQGSTWPPNVVHRDMWDLVGGYSIELSPGMSSDPDFSAKLFFAGVRTFKGLSASRVYHFQARSTSRARKNPGSRQFLAKWGITSRTFMSEVLHRGEPYSESILRKIESKSFVRSHLKIILEAFRKPYNNFR